MGGEKKGQSDHETDCDGKKRLGSTILAIVQLKQCFNVIKSAINAPQFTYQKKKYLNMTQSVTESLSTVLLVVG